jgi:hypothetical protein
MIVDRWFIPGGIQGKTLVGADKNATNSQQPFLSGCIVLLYQYFTFCRIETEGLLQGWMGL